MIYLVLFVHWIADFVLQTSKQATNKSSSNYWLGMHILTYTACMCVFGFKFALINGGIHFFVDYVTSRLGKYFREKNQTHNFFAVIGFDQFVHTAVLIYTMDMVAWSL